MSMTKFLVRRLLQGLFVIWGAVTLIFALRALAPGDPANLMLAEGATEEARQRVREDLGLDQPVYVQYFDYLQGVAVGDLGISYRENRAVLDIIIERIPATLELAIAATIVAIVIAIPLGVISATNRDEPSDYGATLFSLLGISTPNFWLGLMLILLFSVELGLLPTGRRAVGFGEVFQNLIVLNGGFPPDVRFPLAFGAFVDDMLTFLAYITLPAITLGTYFTALITRLTRSGMVDELGKPYVTATKAKGVPETLVRYKHVLRNTMIPIVTVLGLQMGTLMGGAVITETVFNWPGLGLRLIRALRIQDWPIIQGIVVFVAFAFIIINIVVDAMYAYLDPRVRDE